ncbi:DUF3891 family protein [Bythopirellula polymerisocia]|uniref:DUF3891 domain-containing protein n=1 Tax=Bythopirellula polymerisocia TaxID=2528003 RepID=A0A5C6CYS4_9BACT|nr:DUF3891 family protein [Bythopirellula polymerisocia]TWU29538.1 hypothetical protein Pla144_03160 [Bythopirellula polymerisocia]
MICREVVFADSVPYWLLISQVEHARLSGYLAELCLDQFGESVPSADRDALTAVQQELLQAIIHHDDGWREWESCPPLDKDLHRPLSFDEVPAQDAFKIWTNSALAASEFGDLAPWVVASHFSAILATSEHHLADPQAKQWLQDTSQQRTQWFTNWHSANEHAHTMRLAGEALKWLQLFDILSLWPCMLYPVVGEIVQAIPKSFRTSEDWVLVREICPASDASQQIVFDPWPFMLPSITLEAAAQMVPFREYKNSAELFAAAKPFTACWELVPR